MSQFKGPVQLSAFIREPCGQRNQNNSLSLWKGPTTTACYLQAAAHDLRLFATVGCAIWKQRRARLLNKPNVGFPTTKDLTLLKHPYSPRSSLISYRRQFVHSEYKNSSWVLLFSLSFVSSTYCFDILISIFSTPFAILFLCSFLSFFLSSLFFLSFLSPFSNTH